MAGTLSHSKSFARSEYIGNDGRPHYELIPVDGGTDVVSISSWREVQQFCSTLGIPHSAWPEFENEFDIPLDDVEEKNLRIRTLLPALPREQTKKLYWLDKLISYVWRAELFYFSRQ